MNIVQYFDGDSFRKIDRTIFEVAKVSHLFKCIVFEVVFSINFSDGLSIGYEHYLDGRLAKLQTLHLEAPLDISMQFSKEEEKLNEVAYEASRRQIRSGLNKYGPLTWGQSRGFMPNMPYTLTDVDEALRKWDAAEGKIRAKNREARHAFTKETQEIFAFQTTFGNRRKWVRGEMGEWMWTEIVAARIQNDVCEEKAIMKVEDTL